jgi:hypothetical protein
MTLGAEGLEHELADGHMIGMVWTYSTALGWIRLRVADADFQGALDALDPPDEVEWPVEFMSEDPSDRCPVCTSTNLEFVSGARKTLALMLVTFYIPFWFWRSKVRCKDCRWSRAVPLRFRPELVAAWFLSAIVASVITEVVAIAAGYAFRGRA